MFALKVFYVSYIILNLVLQGECGLLRNDSLIEAQSMGRIVNRPNQKEIEVNFNQLGNKASHLSDITRSSNIDQGYPTDASQEGKINENPPVIRNEFTTYMSSQSTSTNGFQLQIQNPPPIQHQHIHYHHLVPNTPTKPTINYVSQPDVNSQDIYSPTTDFQSSHRIGEYQNQFGYVNQGAMQGSPLYSALDKNGYNYDSSDEHQGQASENTSVYESAKQQGALYQEEAQHHEEAITNVPEVYFIKYKGKDNAQPTSTPESDKQNDASNAIFDGTGLIDIRSGNDENSTIKSETEEPESSSVRVYSAYNVPLN
ncbi:hypothetical protein KR009_005308 [Drosophila setifemur]|nr:hypothetical protein KR009_005308 [Drosophila setifemur]